MIAGCPPGSRRSEEGVESGPAHNEAGAETAFRQPPLRGVLGGRVSAIGSAAAERRPAGFSGDRGRRARPGFVPSASRVPDPSASGDHGYATPSASAGPNAIRAVVARGRHGGGLGDHHRGTSHARGRLASLGRNCRARHDPGCTRILRMTRNRPEARWAAGSEPAMAQPPAAGPLSLRRRDTSFCFTSGCRLFRPPTVTLRLTAVRPPGPWAIYLRPGRTIPWIYLTRKGTANARECTRIRKGRNHK